MAGESENASGAGRSKQLPPILWSTNTRMKYRLNDKYGGGRHHVWCSPVFKASALGRFAPGVDLARSSDPFEIYRELHNDCQRSDRHSAKIAQQKSTLAGVAVMWHSQGTITAGERDEIIALLDHATFRDWVPLVYVISTDRVANRLKKVPVADRAGLEDEFIVPDLAPGEFDLIELTL